MKVLLLSIPTGYGHHQTAISIQDYFEINNVQSHMLDICEYVNIKLSKSVEKTYLISTKFTPKTYGRLYRKSEKKDKGDYTLFIDFIEKLAAKKLAAFVNEYNPDVVVCTHIFAAHFMTYLRKRGLVDVPCIGIVTDFTAHPFWEDADIDYYVTASDLLNNQMKKKGISEEKILPIGIPIKHKFAIKIHKKEAREQLGIKNKDTILIMTGSMGYGNVLEKIKQIDELDNDFQILCVCGFNKNLKKAVEEQMWKKDMYCFGFVDNIDIMMDASDCIVTKPGGLTTSESLAKGLVPILINPIPGQEDRNVEFLVNNGIAIKTSDTFPIDEAIFQLLMHKEKQEKTEEMVRYMGKPNSTRDLYEFIMKKYGD